MRLPPLLFAAALALAACGGSDRGEGETNKTANPGADETATNRAMPAAVSADEKAGDVATATGITIPALFQGVYDESREACARPSEYRLHITERELRFHESIGTVAKVAVENARGISVLADYEGEGEKWRSNRRLVLAENGAKLVVSGDGTRLTRIRCP